MLPLHDPRWTAWVGRYHLYQHREIHRFVGIELTVRERTEVGFLVMSFGVERVGDTGQIRLEKLVL